MGLVKNFTSKSFPVVSDRLKTRSPLCLTSCSWTFASSMGPRRASKSPLTSGHFEIVTLSQILLRSCGGMVKGVVRLRLDIRVSVKTTSIAPSSDDEYSSPSESRALIDVFPQPIAISCLRKENTAGIQWRTLRTPGCLSRLWAREAPVFTGVNDKVNVHPRFDSGRLIEVPLGVEGSEWKAKAV